MGFLSKIVEEVRRFTADAVQFVAPVAGAIVGGPAGLAAGLTLGQLASGAIRASPDPVPVPSGGPVPTAPPMAPAMPQIGLAPPAGVATATAAPPGAFAGLLSGMGPLFLIGGAVLLVVLSRGR